MAKTELSSKNLYDYLSKNNTKQRKIERLLEVFDANQIQIEELLMAGESWGVFIYDKEDGWKNQEFSKIDSQKFFDFVYASKVPTSTPKVEKKPENKQETKIETKPEIKAETKPAPKLEEVKTKAPVKKTEPKQIRKVTETPKNLASVKAEEKIIQKDFNIRALYKILEDHAENGVQEKKFYEYFRVKEEDLRFVLDYLEFKGVLSKDTQSNWFANKEESKNPLIDKTLIGLRNSAILNNEFKKKAMRSTTR